MFDSWFKVVERPLDAIRTDRLRRLYAYWESARHPQRWLAYERLRPEDIAFVLADVALLERGADGAGFHVRLAGEALRHEGLGFVRGGASADFRPAWFRMHMEESCRAAFRRAGPVLDAVTLRYDGREFDYERLFLPLVRRGAEPDHLLMGAVLPQPLIDLKATAKSCLG
jgi:hypothetical protein